MEASLSGKTCLITGASGFIGSHVTKLLVEEKARVRVLVRKTSSTQFLDSFPAEKVVGDLSDIPSLQKAIDGVEYLFHVAGVVALREGDTATLRRVNVQGVRNVLGVAQDLRVKRVILTSSVAAIGGSSDQTLRDENSPWHENEPHSAYSRSKHDGEMEAMKYFREGLPLVVVNPSFVIGCPDYGLSIGGKFLLNFLKGRFKAYVRMGFNCVDVKDVAKGHLLAATRGHLGERYILANQNVTLIELLHLLEKVSGTRAPRFYIPYSVAYGGAMFLEGIGKLFGKRFWVSRVQVRRVRYNSWFSHEKATRELGWRPRPLEETLKEAVAWFRDYHLTRRSPSHDRP